LKASAPGKTASNGGKLKATGAKENVDLIVSGEEPLLLHWRLEAPLQFFTLASGSV
jgi:hypothetical protein